MINWAVYTFNTNRLEQNEDEIVEIKTNLTQLPNITKDAVTEKVSESEVTNVKINLKTKIVIIYFLLLFAAYCFHIRTFNTNGFKSFP